MNNVAKYEKEIYKLLDKGITDRKEIMERTGCSRNTASKYIKLFNSQNKIINIVPEKESEEESLSTIMDDFKNNCEELYDQYEQIFETLKSIDKIIQDIPILYNQIGELDVRQSKILHDFESCRSEQELDDLSNELLSIRKQRRYLKNSYFLAIKLRSTLQHYKIHSAIFESIISNLSSLINICKNPVYTPPKPKEYIHKNNLENKEDELEDWQKNISNIIQQKNA